VGVKAGDLLDLAVKQVVPEAFGLFWCHDSYFGGYIVAPLLWYNVIQGIKQAKDDLIALHYLFIDGYSFFLSHFCQSIIQVVLLLWLVLKFLIKDDLLLQADVDYCKVVVGFDKERYYILKV